MRRTLAALIAVTLVPLACVSDTPSEPTTVSLAIVDGADHGGRPLTADMTGAAERPGPGDPDGTGTAFFTLNSGQEEICYELTVANIDLNLTGAHIHRAPSTSPGPIVVPLSPPTSGFSSGCVFAPRELIKDIRQNPENYYVNVHNTTFRPGAVRGQLSK